MGTLVRFGVSIDKELSVKFDKHLKQKSYATRSEAIRDLIRAELVQQEWQEGKEIAGAITLIYDHHKRELTNHLMDLQHDFGGIIISTQHVHLDHHNCLEIIAVKGPARHAKELAHRLGATKGVKHTSFAMATTGAGV